MADGPEAPAGGIAYSRLFPWVRLFRAFGIASDAKKLILAAAGLVLAYAGWSQLDRAFGRTAAPPAPWVAQPAPAAIEQVTGMTVYPLLTVVRTETVTSPPEPGLPTPMAWAPWHGWRTAPWRLAEPVRALVGPFVSAFAAEARASAFLHAVLSAVWGVLVWGLVGGAIARVALLDVARSRALNLTGAVRFAAGRAVTLVAAPLCPLLAVSAFALFLALFGLLYRVPGAGATTAGALAFLPLLAGLVMTVVLVCLALGWPLMPPAVAAEGEDAFDALSRAFAYVNQRRGRYLFYAVLAWAIGSAGLVFVDVFAGMVVRLAEWGLSFSAPRDELLALWGAGGDAGLPAAAAAHRFWVGVVALLVRAWVFSYFWSASAIVYLLLRHDVDGTPFHELALAETPRPAPAEPQPETAVNEPAAPAEVA
jgi:hypothetical protein